jgi:WXG100 family type VII secretion target
MPNLKKIEVDSNSLSSTASAISASIGELQKMEAALKKDMLPNLATFWQGPAKEAFAEKFGHFLANFADLIKGYEEVNEQLAKAADEYEKAEAAAKAAVARLLKKGK